jgi:hypothetical protein
MWISVQEPVAGSSEKHTYFESEFSFIVSYGVNVVQKIQYKLLCQLLATLMLVQGDR